MALASWNVYMVVVSLFVVLLWKGMGKRAHRPPLPPGPPGLPIVGNAFDIPGEYQWLEYNRWASKYGNIMYTRVFGQETVILQSSKAAEDLLEKRSSKYSDKLLTPMMKLMGWDWDFGLMEYGQKWRERRRTFHQYFNHDVVKKYRPTQLSQTRKYLKRLLADPEHFVHLTRRTFGAMIAEVVYGFEDQDTIDEYIDLNDRALGAVVEGFTHGQFWIDYMPFLRYVPTWMPGANFKRRASKWKEEAIAVRRDPFNKARRALESGDSKVSSISVTAKMIEELASNPAYNEELVKDVAGLAFAAGADTTMSAMLSFFLAMVTHPEVQCTAQAELDAVVGPDRLPDFQDRTDLVYINAIVKECLRWQPVSPLAPHHRSTADDVYNGLFIPKGALVIGNAWAMLHDPEIYPQPEKFMPERFIRDGILDPTVRDPGTAAFGFGRRICPGRHFSDNSLFIMVASVLHAFSIGTVQDQRGVPVVPEVRMTSGFISYPVEFPCTITPRSDSAKALLRH